MEKNSKKVETVSQVHNEIFGTHVPCHVLISIPGILQSVYISNLQNVYKKNQIY